MEPTNTDPNAPATGGADQPAGSGPMTTPPAGDTGMGGGMPTGDTPAPAAPADAPTGETPTPATEGGNTGGAM